MQSSRVFTEVLVYDPAYKGCFANLGSLNFYVTASAPIHDPCMHRGFLEHCIREHEQETQCIIIDRAHRYGAQACGR